VVNGVLVHGLDYDDTHLGGVVHATASLWPTVLAVGARQGASGAEALEADIRRKYDTNAARALAAPRAADRRGAALARCGSDHARRGRPSGHALRWTHRPPPIPRRFCARLDFRMR